jgi:hypothetical protein
MEFENSFFTKRYPCLDKTYYLPHVFSRNRSWSLRIRVLLDSQNAYLYNSIRFIIILIINSIYHLRPIPVNARSKAWNCSRPLVRISGSNRAGAFMSVAWEYCVLSGRGLCFGLIIVRMSSTECCVSECDRAASIMRKLWFNRGCCIIKNVSFRYLT